MPRLPRVSDYTVHLKMNGYEVLPVSDRPTTNPVPLSVLTAEQRVVAEKAIKVAEQIFHEECAVFAIPHFNAKKRWAIISEALGITA